jgi:hypothetical protein
MYKIRKLKKIPPWVKVLGQKEKSATRIASKEFFKGSIIET